jgi:hypothetical protein
MRHPILLGLFLCFSTPAIAAPKLFVFEVEGAKGREQSSLRWEKGTLTYVTNSNFTQKASNERFWAFSQNRFPLSSRNDWKNY